MPRANHVGRTLSERYQLTALIAAGGVATVYRAKDLGTQGEVAVKVLRPDLTDDPVLISRLKREAVFMRGLSHPNIVRVLDFGADGALWYLVMELLEGEDLFQLLGREGQLAEASAKSIAAAVCDALAEAHGQGIIHRDLKPENVFLARRADGSITVKVLDFGIAKTLDPDDGSQQGLTAGLTKVGMALGTPEYMSPEQCRAELPGPRSDVYACGALLYAMLTGRPPFVGRHAIEIATRHVGDIPDPPRVHRPGLDPRLDALILRTLAKDPKDRPAGAAALATELRALA
jgi:serine/threonine-protein kinase